MNSQHILAAAVATSIVINRRKRRRQIQAKRRFWIRSWLRRRYEQVFFENLQKELELEDRAGYQNLLRVSPELFKEMLYRIIPRISRTTTFMQKPIEPALRLAITLRYLATGSSYQTLEYEYRVAHNTVSSIVPDTCKALIAEFAEEFLKCPSTADEWRGVAKGFADRWNFFNCLGALDGKHVAIRAPGGSGSVYYNYKGFFSVVLMALVDSQYRFLYVEVGANGGCSDGGVFADTPLYDAFEQNTIGIPDADCYPGDDQQMPYAVVADDAFALKTWLLKPFPQRRLTREQRLYNYRLSRARRVVENDFGILAHRFRFLLAPMPQKTENVEVIVLAACILHNILRTRCPKSITRHADFENPNTHDVIPGTWRDNDTLLSLQTQLQGNSTRSAKALRDYQCMYYTGPVGSVPWQDSMI